MKVEFYRGIRTRNVVIVVMPHQDVEVVFVNARKRRDVRVGTR